MNRKFAALAFAVVCSWIVLMGPASAQDSQNQSPRAKQPSKIAYLIQDRVKKIQDHLAEGRPLSPEAAAHFSDNLLRVTSAGELEVEFHAAKEVGNSEKAALRAFGATILASTSDFVWPRGTKRPQGLGIIAARIPYHWVEVAATLPWVVAITPAEQSPPDVGTFLSEGVALHGADKVQALGIDGTGVTVGVISDGVTNLATSQGLGELPPTVTIPAGCGVGSGNEGTAMLEIIHDMAPGAALLWCATGGSVTSHVNAQLNLVAAGANIIAEDIPFDTEPAFQKGLAATTGDSVAASAVALSSSAGNLGATHSARVQAVGTGQTPDGVVFNATPTGCPYTPNNAVAIAPGNDTTFDVTLGAGANTFVLQWSEPRAIFPTAGQGGFTDLDLFVMDAGLTQCLGSSANVQANGVGDTIEQVSVSVASATAAKIVVNVNGTSTAVAAPLLDLRWRNAAAVDTATRAGSMNPDSNYTDNATSAAAANASTSTNPATVAIEPFSAGGPVQLITTTECSGGAAGPCTGVAGGAGRTVGAPSWTAADGVSVSGVGGFGSGSCPGVTEGDCRFFGTSAAAPHAAGVMALVRQAMGGTPTSAKIDAQLTATATDRGPAGFDNVWGAGVLNALAAVNAKADLQLTKICKPDGSVTAGGTGTCTIFVDNLGPADAQNVVVTDTLLSNGTFTISSATFSPPANGSCSIAANVVTCSLGTVPAGTRTTVIVTVTSNNQVDVNDTASVSASTPDPNPSNNSATGHVSFVAAADLSIVKSAPTTAVAGTSFSYVITVNNAGPSTATGVVVKDTSPGQTSVLSVTPTTGSCTSGIPGNPLQPLTCTLGNLAPLGSAAITVTVAVSPSVPDGTVINNNATVSSSVVDPNNADNSGSAAVTVQARADLVITKTSDKTVYKPSSVITYTIAVTNNGPSDALAVIVTDNLPTTMQASYQSDTGGCTKSGLTLTCNLGNMPVGTSKSFIMRELVKGTRGVVSNTASVISSTTDPSTANNASTRAVTIGH
jgi:uncharacterized repeat protein (TIGR01451 family)